MRYLVRVDELNEKNRFLEEKLKIISEKIDNMEKLKEEFIWEGPSKNAFIVKYDEYINNLKNISNRIVMLLAFLKSYYSNFNDEYEKLRSKYGRILIDEVKLWH